jgi:chemotaxis protein CheD
MSGTLTLAAPYTHRQVVGIGDMAVSGEVDVVLSTYALGSCVGVVAFDPINRSGGILHVMLPDSAIAPAKASKQPALFADTGLALFLRALRSVRAYQANLQVVVAGGANVLCGADPYRIGERNAQVTLDYLAKRSFAIRHTHIGGGLNRALHLELGTGLVTVKTPTDEVQYQLGH